MSVFPSIYRHAARKKPVFDLVHAAWIWSCDYIIHSTHMVCADYFFPFLSLPRALNELRFLLSFEQFTRLYKFHLVFIPRLSSPLHLSHFRVLTVKNLVVYLYRLFFYPASLFSALLMKCVFGVIYLNMFLFLCI